MSAPISRLWNTPGLQAEIEAVMAKDDAYGRMLEAAMKRDDAAYEQARRDFWGEAGLDV